MTAGVIHSGAQFTRDVTERCDVCVIGSGPGGAVAAKELAERGADVVLVEQGPPFDKADFTQREDEMLPRLYDSGGHLETRDGSFRILAGRGLGGATLQSHCLVFDTPSGTRDHWAGAFGIPGMDNEAWTQVVTHVRGEISATPIRDDEVNANNALVTAGRGALGWSGGVAEHNRVECLQCGYCELGCAFDRMRDMSKTYIPAAVARGARVYTDVRAERLARRGDGVVRLHARILERRTGVPRLRMTVHARHFVVAAGAVRTPELLLRSRLGRPGGPLGRHLHLQPTSLVLGEMAEDVEAWKGIPQSAYVDEFGRFAQHGAGGYVLLGGYLHPAQFAAHVPGVGAAHADLMARYARFAGVTALVRDEGAGRVRVDRRNRVVVDYRLTPRDTAVMREAWLNAGRLLFAAGAVRVILPYLEPAVVRNERELRAAVARPLLPGMHLGVSAQPQGSARMGPDPATAATDGTGRLHGIRNVSVTDASCLPSPVGVPPQLTIMANATRIAWGLAGGGVLRS